MYLKWVIPCIGGTPLEIHYLRGVQGRKFNRSRLSFVGVGSTNPKTPVSDYEYHEHGYQLRMLSASGSVHIPMKRWCLVCHLALLLHKLKRSRATYRKSLIMQIHSVFYHEMHSYACKFISNVTTAYCVTLKL